MNAASIRTLFDYNYWANARVLAAADRVSPEQFAAPAGLSHGSIHGALAHVFAAESVWRQRCAEGISPPALPTEHDFPTLHVLRAAWKSEEAALRAFLATLTDERLAAPVRYRTTSGAPNEMILWELLAHVVNHGTQFRAEAAVALTAFGASPGDLDLLLYLRHRDS